MLRFLGVGISEGEGGWVVRNRESEEAVGGDFGRLDQTMMKWRAGKGILEQVVC